MPRWWFLLDQSESHSAPRSPQGTLGEDKRPGGESMREGDWQSTTQVKGVRQSVRLHFCCVLLTDIGEDGCLSVCPSQVAGQTAVHPSILLFHVPDDQTPIRGHSVSAQGPEARGLIHIDTHQPHLHTPVVTQQHRQHSMKCISTQSSEDP